MRLILLAPLLAALLAGCASQPPAPAAPPALPAAPEAVELTAWTLTGKAGLRVLGQSLSVTYRWQRQGNDYSTEAAGPLDQGHTTLVSRNGFVVLENAWLGRFESDDAEMLAKALTSIAIPFTSLNRWLLGWPADSDTPVRLLQADQGIREFDERGWHVRVMAEQNLAGHRLPARVVLSQGDNRINIALATWTPDTP